MQNAFQTYLIEENALVREGLKALLHKANGLEIFEFSTLEEIDAQKPHDECGLIILDAGSLQVASLHTVLDQIKSRCTHARILILIDEINMEFVVQSFSAGADGLILKDISSDAFLNSVSLILLGEKVYPQDLDRFLLEVHPVKEASCIPKNENKNALSDREKDIIVCLENGDANKVIAMRLGITESTVKVHVKTILRKLGLKNRTQAAIWAVNHGMHATEDKSLLH